MTKQIKLRIKSDSQFQSVGTQGVKRLKNGKKDLWDASLYALNHYEQHGDHGKINQVLSWLLDAGVGAHKYRQWVEMYSDQVYSNEDKKFVRDVENKRDDRANTVAASLENYWVGVARQEEDALEFGTEDIAKDLARVLNKYSKRTALNNDAKEMLDFMKRQLGAKVPSVDLR